jgi:DNA-binding MarR family transcriptional regulator
MSDHEERQALIDKRKRGWFWDYNDLFDSSLSEHAIIVRLFLARCANKNQEAWPSLNTIARRCKISKPTAIKAVRELESQGWIRRTVRKTNDEYDSTIYYLEDPPETAEKVHGDDGASAPPGAAGGGKASLPGSKAVLPPGKNEDRGVVNVVDHLVKPVDPNNTHITIPNKKEKDQDDAVDSNSELEPGQDRLHKVPENRLNNRSNESYAPGKPLETIMKGARKPNGATPTNCQVDQLSIPGGEIARLEELRRQEGFYDHLGEAPGDFPCDV